MEKQGKKRLSILTNGLIRENPVLALLLGTCPSLAITTQAINGLGMGLAATFVLVCSNAAISLLKNIIPDKARIPAYIVVIAGFVTVVQLLVQAYLPALDKALGLYLPLIVVNCIILGRAEMFASKNGVVNSILDGIGMGLGFTFALLLIGSIREILGSGTWFGLQIIPTAVAPLGIALLPAGGFFIFGTVIALVNRISKGRNKKRKDAGCATCPAAAACNTENDCQEANS